MDSLIIFLFRFDLIFLMLDPQDEFFDRRLATHLVSLYHQTQEEEEEEYLVSEISLKNCDEMLLKNISKLKIMKKKNLKDNEVVLAKCYYRVKKRCHCFLEFFFFLILILKCY